MYYKTCFGGKYIPKVSFPFEGQLPPIYTPKNCILGHRQLKPMDSIFTYLFTSDKAIITKLDLNMKKVKFHINFQN